MHSHTTVMIEHSFIIPDTIEDQQSAEYAFRSFRIPELSFRYLTLGRRVSETSFVAIKSHAIYETFKIDKR